MQKTDICVVRCSTDDENDHKGRSVIYDDELEVGEWLEIDQLSENKASINVMPVNYTINVFISSMPCAMQRL